jgi:uncharacterized protein (TIGR01244 family)
MRRSTLSILLLPLLFVACTSEPRPVPKLAVANVGAIERLHTFGSMYLASQPAEADFKQLKQSGVKTVINLRPQSEQKEFDEHKLATELGLAYVNIPIGKPDELTDAVFAQARKELQQAQKPLLLHCHSGNRVGAIWLAHRVLDDGIAWEPALAEAKEVGLKAPALESKARDYVEREQAAKH